MVFYDGSLCPSPGSNGTDLQTESMTSMKHHKHVKAAHKENSANARDFERRIVTYFFHPVSLQVLENL
jgi:hypothetical protein